MIVNMFYNYNLNFETNWNSLPWKKINTRIIIIQHKIYKAAKQYNLKHLYQLQKYLLNSTEAKINAIQYVTDKLYLYNKQKKIIRYTIYDSSKFCIFKNLYKYNLYNDYYFIIDQIKQYLIYLCIKPEWESKFFINYVKERNTTIIDDINHLEKYYLYNNLFKYNKKNKYIFMKNILKKIRFSKYIQKNLKLSFYKHISIHFKDFKINYLDGILKRSGTFIDEFYIFLSRILLLGIDWYKLFLNKLDFSENQHSLIPFILNNNKEKMEVIYFSCINYFKVLFQSKMFFLYDKNSFYKLVNYQYLHYSDICYNYLFIYFIKLVYPVSNLYLYYYLKKYYNNIFFKYNKLKTKNDYINLVFYNRKIQYIYFNYLS
uniref:Group II intron reverse transcriptase maturase protein n=1 Tax=Cumathamnion serrulatum TaxID=1206573 RepID=A0A7U1AQW8_9FLOR|nr:group II intron reverse transcriptase maturase protein [Cumathamnion serrulatum]QQY85271.1 group II intron reverse transcriptase maturase protein [Cumathamnion serrulatum]